MRRRTKRKYWPFGEPDEQPYDTPVWDILRDWVRDILSHFCKVQAK